MRTDVIVGKLESRIGDAEQEIVRVTEENDHLIGNLTNMELDMKTYEDRSKDTIHKLETELAA